MSSSRAAKKTSVKKITQHGSHEAASSSYKTSSSHPTTATIKIINLAPGIKITYHRHKYFINEDKRSVNKHELVHFLTYTSIDVMHLYKLSDLQLNEDEIITIINNNKDIETINIFNSELYIEPSKLLDIIDHNPSIKFLTYQPTSNVGDNIEINYRIAHLKNMILNGMNNFNEMDAESGSLSHYHENKTFIDKNNKFAINILYYYSSDYVGQSQIKMFNEDYYEGRAFATATTEQFEFDAYHKTIIGYDWLFLKSPIILVNSNALAWMLKYIYEGPLNIKLLLGMGLNINNISDIVSSNRNIRTIDLKTSYKHKDNISYKISKKDKHYMKDMYDDDLRYVDLKPHAFNYHNDIIQSIIYNTNIITINISDSNLGYNNINLSLEELFSNIHKTNIINVNIKKSFPNNPTDDGTYLKNALTNDHAKITSLQINIGYHYNYEDQVNRERDQYINNVTDGLLHNTSILEFKLLGNGENIVNSLQKTVGTNGDIRYLSIPYIESIHLSGLVTAILSNPSSQIYHLELGNITHFQHLSVLIELVERSQILKYIEFILPNDIIHNSRYLRNPDNLLDTLKHALYVIKTDSDILINIHNHIGPTYPDVNDLLNEIALINEQNKHNKLLKNKPLYIKLLDLI